MGFERVLVQDGQIIRGRRLTRLYIIRNEDPSGPRTIPARREVKGTPLAFFFQLQVD